MAGQPEGSGNGVLKWNRNARVNYTQCRAGKGKLQVWRDVLDPMVDPECRFCEEGEPETQGSILRYLVLLES